MHYLRYWLLLGAVVSFGGTLTAAFDATATSEATDDDQLADFEFDANDVEGSTDRLLAAFDGEEQDKGEPSGVVVQHVADRRVDTDPLVLTDSFDQPMNVAASDAIDVQTGRTQNAFAAKELLIRNALQRATRQGAFTRKFAQILPILRTLNPQQRLVLASLITAQSSAAPGKGLDLQQVESMFGERRRLILPILFDVANLVRTAASANAGSRTARTANIDHLPTTELRNYIPSTEDGSVGIQANEHSVDNDTSVHIVDTINITENASTNAGLDISDSTTPSLLSDILNNKELKLDTLFNDQSQNLVMPILQDIANLIRTAAHSRIENAVNEEVGRKRAVEFLEKTSAILLGSPQNENVDTDSSKPICANDNAALQSNSPAPIASALRDDRLQIDEDIDDVLTTRNLVTVNLATTAAADKPISHKKGRSLFATASSTRAVVPGLVEPSLAGRSRRIGDQRSYHERKLNMTNFNGTSDQYAMESEGVPIQITLPRAPMPRSNNAHAPSPMQPAAQQLTLEQYEELAFRDLNETSATTTATSAADAAANMPAMMVRNETTGELLPLPEMLISRNRNKNNPYRKLLAAGSNGIEAVGGGSARQCERFGSLCLQVEDYPTQAIMGSIRRHKHAMSALLAEYIDKDDVESTKALNEEAKRREDDELTPSGMCPSVIRYARPQKARSATGEWKYIVNTGQHTQTLRLEKCTKVDEPCTYLTDNFRSRCVQVFNYHRLLSWDNARGLHIDIFKVPTCCSCHIDSYKEKFPPIITSYNGLQDDYRFSASNIQSQQHQQNQRLPHQQQPHTPQQHHTQSPYATILTADEPQLDDTSAAGTDIDDESIAYQYSNGFKRSPGKHNKYRDTAPSGSSNKPLRFEKPRKPQHPSNSNLQSFAPISPTLDSYLTPPTSDSEFDFVSAFKRGGTASSSPGFSGISGPGDADSIGIVSSSSHSQRTRNRRPVRTNNRDQTVAGSDFLPDHSSVIQSHDHPHHPSVNTAYGISPAIKRQSTTTTTLPMAGIVGNVAAAASATTSTANINTYGQPQWSQPQHQQQKPASTSHSSQHPVTRQQLPSISTASTSAVDLGKRVNYNYHPIIDFFGDSLRPDKEIDDRVGSVDTRTWRPVNGRRQVYGR